MFFCSFLKYGVIHAILALVSVSCDATEVKRLAASDHLVRFSLGDMVFEYDSDKNRKNIEKHGISFPNAARVFFDYDRIELYDDEHSTEENRYNTIGDTSAGSLVTIGNLNHSAKAVNDILFVVYTDRVLVAENGKEVEVTRLISARLATSFERGIYYGKYN